MDNNKREHYHVIIISDEMATDELILVLKSYPDFEIIDNCKTGIRGKKKIQDKKPDLLFLDIQLPDMDGITLLDSINETITWEMQVVFFSPLHIPYLQQAIHKSVFGYLPKPVYNKKEIDKNELDCIIKKFYKERHKSGNKIYDYNETFSPLISYNKILLIACNSVKKAVRINEIVFFSYSSDNKQWKAHLVNGKSIGIRKNTTAKHILKSDRAFRRTNQSFIVNIYYLQTIKNDECRFLPPFDTIKIPLSLAEKKHLEENLTVL